MPARPKKIHVQDKMQECTYILTEPEGKNFHPDFKPQLTPAQMLELGIFGGKYMTDCQAEFPKSWFKKAKLNSQIHDKNLNLFQVNASQPLKVWLQKGWIHPADPRGWFQWYCRYYMGRRLPEEDLRQIKRWKAMVRHIAQLKHNCDPFNYNCRRKQRQALLHWAYDTRKI
jgi:hypothetical protein